MKKVLLVLHGAGIPESVIHFIGRLNERTPLLLTGFFLPELVPIENWAAYSRESVGSLEDVATKSNIKAFCEACGEHRIDYKIHKGNNEPALSQIIRESRYADLMITGSTAFDTKDARADSYPGLKNVLHNAECPVLVVPSPFTFPGEIMIACDGSPSSAFAMKQFVYLFPDLSTMPVQLVHIAPKGGPAVPDETPLKEWASCHFRDYSLHRIDTPPGEYLGAESNPRAILAVTGSYGRSALSEWFRKSFSHDLMMKYKLLLFSAHR